MSSRQGLSGLFGALRLWGSPAAAHQEADREGLEDQRCVDATSQRPASQKQQPDVDNTPALKLCASRPAKRRVCRPRRRARVTDATPVFRILDCLRTRELLGSVASPGSVRTSWELSSCLPTHPVCCSSGVRRSNNASFDSGEDSEEECPPKTLCGTPKLVAGHDVSRIHPRRLPPRTQEGFADSFWERLDGDYWHLFSWIYEVEKARARANPRCTGSEALAKAPTLGRETEAACLELKNTVVELSSILNSLEAGLTALAGSKSSSESREASILTKAKYNAVMSRASVGLFEVADVLVNLLWTDRPLLPGENFASVQHPVTRRSRLMISEEHLQRNFDSTLLSLQNEVLFMIRELCIVFPAIGRYYGQSTRLVLFLFEVVLRQDMTFFNCVGLLEELLASSPRPFDLSLIGKFTLANQGPVYTELSRAEKPNVAGFSDLVRGFSKRQLAYFCRILGLTLFDQDAMSPETFLDRVRNPAASGVANSICGLRLKPSKRALCSQCCCWKCSADKSDAVFGRSQCASHLRNDRFRVDCISEIVTRNHRAVLAVPELLERLCSLVRLSTDEATILRTDPPSNAPLVSHVQQHFRRSNWVEHLMELAPHSLDLLSTLLQRGEMTQLNTFDDLVSQKGMQSPFPKSSKSDFGVCDGLSCVCCRMSWCVSCSARSTKKHACHGSTCSPDVTLAIQSAWKYPLPSSCGGQLGDGSSVAARKLRDAGVRYEKVHDKWSRLKKRIPATAPADIASMIENGHGDGAAVNALLLFGNVLDITDAATQLYQAEILMTLTSLLSPGSHINGSRHLRAQAQMRCVETGLLHRLAAPFTSLSWNRPTQEGGIHNLHVGVGVSDPNHKCDCVSPEATVKLQYLRCVMHLLDGICAGDVKTQAPLLTPAEQLHVRKIAQAYAEVAQMDDPISAGRCVLAVIRESSPSPLPGGMIRSVFDLHAEGPHSFFKYPIANVVEQFLIGSPVALRSWAAATGLLEFVLFSLLKPRRDCHESDGHQSHDEPDNNDSEVAHDSHGEDDDDHISCGNKKHKHHQSQTSFDILGELAKFNLPVLLWIDDELRDEEKFEMLTSRIKNQVIQSSLFVRSFLLTAEWMSAQLEDVDEIPRSLIDFKLMRFVWNNRAQLSARMLDEVSLGALSQENICCVTTALLFCRRELRVGGRSRLREFLGEVSSHMTQSLNEVSKLICFWTHYYAMSSNDSASLARSSGMPVCIWTRLANTVLLCLRDDFNTEVYTPAQLSRSLNESAVAFDAE